MIKESASTHYITNYIKLGGCFIRKVRLGDVSLTKQWFVWKWNKDNYNLKENNIHK